MKLMTPKIKKTGMKLAMRGMVRNRLPSSVIMKISSPLTT
jgi:hypothetical protein